LRLTSGALSDKYFGKLASDKTTRQARPNGEAFRRVAGTKSVMFKWLCLLDQRFSTGAPQETARPEVKPGGGGGWYSLSRFYVVKHNFFIS